MAGKRVLVVDDDAKTVDLVKLYLKRDGYRVLTAYDGIEALRLAREGHPDLIVLDLMLPGIDGLEICRTLRTESDVPVIMLTGRRKSEDDVVRGLESGADEYLTKPIGNRELLARVKATLRRTENLSRSYGKQKVLFQNDYLTVDVEEHKVTVDGERRKLTPREFRLLVLLVKNADHVLSHQQVLENVWGWEYIDDVDYVRIYISHLRQKIERNPSRPQYILTEPGVGYYFSTPN